MLYSSLRASKVRNPDAAALTSSDCRMTYSALVDAVDFAAAHLRDSGLTQGAVVGLALNNSAEFVICLYALAKNHAEIVLFNPQTSAGKLLECSRLVHLDAMIMENYLYESGIRSGASLPVTRVFLRKEDLPAFCPGGNPRPMEQSPEYGRRADEETVVIQCSSGTTGRPKMAVRTNRNLSRDTDNIISTFHYTPEDTVYCPVPASHGYGLTMGILAPLKAGGHVWLDRWFMPNRFIGEFTGMRPTVFLGTPDSYDTLGSFLYEGPDVRLREVRLLLCSGSPLEAETGLRFYGRYGRWVQQLYGMMEASTISCNLEADEHNFLSVGKPVDNVRIRIGETGEIEVRSDTVSARYAAELSGGRERIIQRTGEWFQTGDCGYLDEARRLHIKERIGSPHESL